MLSIQLIHSKVTPWDVDMILDSYNSTPRLSSIQRRQFPGKKYSVARLASLPYWNEWNAPGYRVRPEQNGRYFADDILKNIFVIGNCVFGLKFHSQQGKSEGFDSCDRPTNLKLDSNRQFFRPCDRKIWWMTLQNNRAPLLCYFKHCASFRTHWRIQTWVTVRKRSIRVKIDIFFSCVT